MTATTAATTDTRRELDALLKSRVPLIVIETRDEPRALALLSALTPNLATTGHTPVFQWTVTEGLRRLDISLGGAQQHNAEPDAVLKSMRATPTAGVYILLDFHPFLADPVNVRLLKDICQDYDRVARTVVLAEQRAREAVGLRFRALRGRPARRAQSDERRDQHRGDSTRPHAAILDGASVNTE